MKLMVTPFSRRKSKSKNVDMMEYRGGMFNQVYEDGYHYINHGEGNWEKTDDDLLLQ